MAEISIHLDHDRRPLGDCDSETVEVRAAEALFGWTMEHADARVVFREFIRDLPSSVGRVVVDDEYYRIGDRREDRRSDLAYVARLVVRREDDPGLGLVNCRVSHSTMSSARDARPSPCGWSRR